MPLTGYLVTPSAVYKFEDEKISSFGFFVFFFFVVERKVTFFSSSSSSSSLSNSQMFPQTLTADDPERVHRGSAHDAGDLGKEVHIPLRGPDLPERARRLGARGGAVRVHFRKKGPGLRPRRDAAREPHERERHVEHCHVARRVQLREQEAAVDPAVHRGPHKQNRERHRRRPEGAF